MPCNCFRFRARAALLAVTLAFAHAPAHAQGIHFLTDDPGTTVPISIVASLAPAAVRPGEFARVQVELEIGAPWYIYALPPDPGGGPPTVMTLDEGPFEGTGRYSESPPEEELDLNLGSSVRVHKPRARFWTDVRVPEDAKPGPLTVSGALAYAACNGKICLPLRRVIFRAEAQVEAGPSRQVGRANEPAGLPQPPSGTR